MKHKSSDYKLQAVKYYINNNSSLSKTCAIFNCSNRSLKRRKENKIFIFLA